MASQRFKVLVPFEDEQTKSQYERGLKYHIRDGNTTLAAKVALWVTQGKVEMVEADLHAVESAALSGKGKVT